MGNEQSSNPVIRERPLTSAAGGPTTQRAAAASLPRTMSCRNGRLEQDVRAEVEHHRRNLFDRQFSQTEPFPGAPDNESPQWGWCKLLVVLRDSWCACAVCENPVFVRPTQRIASSSHQISTPRHPLLICTMPADPRRRLVARARTRRR
jgi:hypothetical protein